jgi:hypothetical protein
MSSQVCGNYFIADLTKAYPETLHRRNYFAYGFYLRYAYWYGWVSI